MSRLNSLTTRQESVFVQSVEEVKLMLQNENTVQNAKEHVPTAFAMESYNFDTSGSALTNFRNFHSDVKASVMSTAFGRQVISALQPEQREIALEAFTMTLVGASKPSEWFAKSAFSQSNMHADAVLIEPSQGRLQYPADRTAQAALEGFDPTSANKWTEHSSIANAMATIQGNFEETWYPIMMIPAGVGGVDVTITIPKIQPPISRAGGAGTPRDFGKISLIDAIVDSKHLENDSTTIFPVVTGDGAKDANLVAAAKVPDMSVTVEGTTLSFRPVLFDVDIDMIDKSSHPGLIASGVMNEQDALDPVINIGKVFHEVTVNDGTNTRTAVLGCDISRQTRALMQRVAEGRGREYITNGEFRLAVSQDTAIASVTGGSAAEFRESIRTALGLGLTDEFQVTFLVRLAGQADTETGRTNVAWVSTATVESAVGPAGATAAIASTASLTTAKVGYLPTMRRTNSNLRNRGTIIDSTDTLYFRFPTRLHAPIISQNAVGATANTSVEGLAHAQRIRNNNNAHKCLLAAVDMLKEGASLQLNSPTIGAQLVRPRYKYSEVDVTTVVQTMDSKNSVDNLRASLLTALAQGAAELLTDGRYLAALEFTTGNNMDYETLVVTDPTIYGWLMEGGEPRSMGQARNFRFSQSLNKDFAGKIFYSFRRLNRDGTVHPLDHGVFLFTPALTHEVQVSRGTTTSVEVHTIPVNAHFNLLPLIGEIDVTGLDKMYVSGP